MKKIIINLIASFLLCISISSHASTAASCSKADVEIALIGISAGETVTVPSTGSPCTWTSFIDLSGIPDNVTIAGSGTPIINGTNSGQPLFFFFPSTRLTIRGFDFRNAVGGTKYNFSSGNLNNFRFTNNIVDIGGFDSTFFVIYGIASNAVIDNNTIKNGYGVNYECSESTGAWSTALTFGSITKVLYIENNTFTCPACSAVPNAIDANTGARYVFRYNNLINYTIGHHGYDSGVSSTYQYEVYNNTITYQNPSGGGGWMTSTRGGTGFVFNNTFNPNTGYSPQSEHIFRQYRASADCLGEYASNCSARDYCDGDTAADGNDVIDSGTHTGADSPTVLTSSIAEGWTTNIWIGSYIFNTTDGSKCKITANTSNTVTCTLAGGTGNNWQSGDSFQIKTGYPCREQAGRGTNQGLYPVYVWGNTANAYIYSASGADARISSLMVVANRDFYSTGSGGVTSGTLGARPSTCSPKAGYWSTTDNTLYQCSATDTWSAYYTPLVYPHPLVGGVAPPTVPTLLTPADNTTAGWPVDFSWQVYAGATGYGIQVDDQSNFSSPAIDNDAISTSACDATTCHYYVSYGGPLLPGVRYYWRVRARLN